MIDIDWNNEDAITVKAYAVTKDCRAFSLGQLQTADRYVSLALDRVQSIEAKALIIEMRDRVRLTIAARYGKPSDAHTGPGQVMKPRKPIKWLAGVIQGGAA